MRKLKLLLVAGAVSLVALVVMSATASAFRGTAVRAGAISAPSLGAVTFEGGATITCNVTLNGSALSSATIVAGTRIGEITEVRTASCSGGSIRAILVGTGASAWPVRQNSVPAGLPNEVRSGEILIEGVSFNLAVFGGFVECLYRGNTPGSGAATATRTAGVYTTGLTSILTNTSSFVSGSGLCPRTGSFRGTFGLTPLQTVTVS